MFERTRIVGRGVAVIAGAVLLSSTIAAVARGEDGKAAFEKNCASCHGVGGKGDGPVGKVMKPPPGDFATKLKTVSDGDIAKLIKEGGKAVGKNHPAFGSKLNDDAVAAVVQYVKELAAK